MNFAIGVFMSSLLSMRYSTTSRLRPRRKKLAGPLQPAAPRIYLLGSPAMEVNGTLCDHRAFPGRQGVIAFALLVLERARPVTRDELAAALWAGKKPRAYASTIQAVVSRIRACLARAGWRDARLEAAFGCYQLMLPGPVWIDVEAAAEAIYEAELSLRAGDVKGAFAPAVIAHHIARRPFLPGEESTWVASQRDRIRELLVRAIEVRAQVHIANDEGPLAVLIAKQAVELEPYRESGYRVLMRAHASAGNCAEALWVYERCRRVLADELGVDPSPETKEIHRDVLRRTSAG
jgi:DNA-binding SARP family transcriptional activator